MGDSNRCTADICWQITSGSNEAFTDLGCAEARIRLCINPMA